jgi:hypothetical protein
MPRYKKENPADFQIIKIEMSDFQFGIYEEARVQERNQERKNATKKKMNKPGVDGLYENTTSTYRIFSRAFCNFVFPRPAIARPMPDKKDKKGEEVNLADAIQGKDVDEDVLDAVSAKEKANRDEAFDGEEGEGEGEGHGQGASPIGYAVPIDQVRQAILRMQASERRSPTPLPWAQREKSAQG